jgi:hypothetical protein
VPLRLHCLRRATLLNMIQAAWTCGWEAESQQLPGGLFLPDMGDQADEH